MFVYIYVQCTRVTAIIKKKKWRVAVYSLLIPPRYSSQGLFLISQTIRNDGALSFIVCAKKTNPYTPHCEVTTAGERRAYHQRVYAPSSPSPRRMRSPETKNSAWFWFFLSLASPRGTCPVPSATCAQFSILYL